MWPFRHRAWRVWLTLRGHTFLAAPINANSVVVDLGANRGDFSRRVYDRFGCMCIAVEPTPHLFEQIRELQALRAFNYAIHDRDGEAMFHLSSNAEASTLVNNTAYATLATTIVPVRTLESFLMESGIARVDLLKVDIEGAEIGMLQATSDQTLQRIDQISIEFHDFCGLVSTGQIRAVRRRLRQLGFDEIHFAVNNTDWLFVRRAAPWMTPTRRLHLRVMLKLRALLHWLRRRTGRRIIGLIGE